MIVLVHYLLTFAANSLLFLACRHLKANARFFPAFGADKRDIGYLQRRRKFNYLPFLALLFWPGMLFAQIYAFHHQSVRVAQYLQDLAGFTA